MVRTCLSQPRAETRRDVEDADGDRVVPPLIPPVERRVHARQFSGVPGCTAVGSPRARTRSAMSSRIAIVCGPVRFLASTRLDAPSITLAANSTPARNDETSIGLESSISDMDRLRGFGGWRIGRGDESVLDSAAHGFLVAQDAARE